MKIKFLLLLQIIITFFVFNSESSAIKVDLKGEKAKARVLLVSDCMVGQLRGYKGKCRKIADLTILDERRVQNGDFL